MGDNRQAPLSEVAREEVKKLGLVGNEAERIAQCAFIMGANWCENKAVRAVNSHEELVKALKEALELLDDAAGLLEEEGYISTPIACKESVIKIKEALSKAEQK